MSVLRSCVLVLGLLVIGVLAIQTSLAGSKSYTVALQGGSTNRYEIYAKDWEAQYEIFANSKRTSPSKNRKVRASNPSPKGNNPTRAGTPPQFKLRPPPPPAPFPPPPPGPCPPPPPGPSMPPPPLPPAPPAYA